MPERLYKNRVGKVLTYQAYNFEAEVGDKMVDIDGSAYVLRQSRGKWKSLSWELTPVRIKPPVPGAKAFIRDGQMWWRW